MWRVALAGTLLAGACTLRADYAGTSFRCDDGACPAGQVCLTGVCTSMFDADAAPPPPDAGESTPDARAPDAAPPDAGDPDASWPANLITNPGMEDGLAGWSTYQATLVETINMPHTGVRAIKACKDPLGADDVFTAYTDVISSPGPVPMGARYTARIWVRASLAPGEPPPASIWLILRERGGAAPNRDADGVAVTPLTTSWAELTTEIVVQEPDRTGLSLIVWAAVSPDGTCFAIDDAYTGRLE